MSRFEVVSNTVIVVAALAVVGNNLYSRLVPPVPPARAALTREYLGKSLSLPQGTVRPKKATVVMFISKDCHFCTDSMDFYQRLGQLRSVPACNVQIVAVGPKDRQKREELESYLTSHNLTVDGLAMVKFVDFHVFGTPTLMVEDAALVVRGLWIGKLSPKDEEEAFTKTESLCHG